MKNLKNLGKTLSKNEQKMINGGMLSLGGGDPEITGFCVHPGGYNCGPTCDPGTGCHVNFGFAISLGFINQQSQCCI